MTVREAPDFLRAYLRTLPLHRAVVRCLEARLYWMHASQLRGPILDVGSGDGSFAQVVLPGAAIYGIDPLPRDTREAQSRQAYRGLSVDNGAAIPFGTASFASTICNCVLEHVAPLHETLAEIGRVTMPGGVFIATVVTDRFSASLLGSQVLTQCGLPGTIYSDWLNRKANHRNLLSREAWAAALDQAGFDVLVHVPYLGGRTMQIFDFGHYWALPSLLTYKLTGRWHLADALNATLLWERLLRETYEQPEDEAGTCLFLLGRRR